ncbi:hypothetical protein [Chromobacterium sp. ASV23]|uniref:hypothetical protein n=1 Tax=Chromobacterium sp. ASV23 TaxID=2795110 RepID=UPI001E43EF79|nr:hypothetical protein [Chromobacterium sp. ASV23]
MLFSRRALQSSARDQRLQQEARRHAQRILRDAERHADILRQHAYQEGYEQGLLSALQQIATYLSAYQTMAWSWRERLNQHARAMLSCAVDHPDTLLLLLDEWLHDLEQGDATLHLTLPQASRAHQHRLMELLAEHWSGPIQLDYHADPRCIMRCGDQLAEFAPELYVEPASRQLQQCLDAMPQDCRQISAQALRELISQWEAQANDTIDRSSE